MIKELYLKWKKRKYENFVYSLDSYEMEKLGSLLWQYGQRKGLSIEKLNSMSIPELFETILRS
ncbi:hypothetical protein KAR50_07700 [Periweissella fabaria]|uniref:FAD assembly factor SdhE n=1 Tax=Periweissella fabaria TaxID=546157 RepID=A0ABN8BMW6_9LACO|nr:hypothetical protein [Periweissella fabaria]MCM0597720.1 hypothetical protein [Periweissella fabaria]CAH0417169.1 hypothetical protein WFA24289_01498 [Periweissella fabaria]